MTHKSQLYLGLHWFLLDAPASCVAGAVRASDKCRQMINKTLLLLDVPASCGAGSVNASSKCSQL